MFNIRVAVLHHALGRFGGGEKLALLHSIYLKKLGLDVELFYNGPITQDWKEKILTSVSLNSLPFGLPKSLKTIGELKRTVRSLENFDVILIHHHICPFLAAYLSGTLRSRLVWYCGEPLRALWENHISGLNYKDLSLTVKSTSSGFYGKTLTTLFLSKKLYDISVSFLRSLDKITTKRYKKIIANSKYTKELIEKIYGVSKPIAVVYPGVEIKSSGRLINEETNGYILSIGALIPMKNHITLLKAFKLFQQQHKDTKLIMVGRGPLERKLKNAIYKYNIRNIIFKPIITEQALDKYYANCKFIVHIALHEPFGLVPVEAALYGKTSIVSNIGGVTEFIVDGENGFLVNPYDYKQIAKLMSYLIEDENLTANLGTNAMKKALKEFTIENSTKKLVKTLKTSNMI